MAQQQAEAANVEVLPVTGYRLTVFRKGLRPESFDGTEVSWGISENQRLEVIEEHGEAGHTRTIYAPGAWTKLTEEVER